MKNKDLNLGKIDNSRLQKNTNVSLFNSNEKRNNGLNGILGTTGAGKTYYMKELLKQDIANGLGGIFITDSGDYFGEIKSETLKNNVPVNHLNDYNFKDAKIKIKSISEALYLFENIIEKIIVTDDSYYQPQNKTILLTLIKALLTVRTEFSLQNIEELIKNKSKLKALFADLILSGEHENNELVLGVKKQNLGDNIKRFINEYDEFKKEALNLLSFIDKLGDYKELTFSLETGLDTKKIIANQEVLYVNLNYLNGTKELGKNYLMEIFLKQIRKGIRQKFTNYYPIYFDVVFAFSKLHRYSLQELTNLTRGTKVMFYYSAWGFNDLFPDARSIFDLTTVFILNKLPKGFHNVLRFPSHIVKLINNLDNNEALYYNKKNRDLNFIAKIN